MSHSGTDEHAPTDPGWRAVLTCVAARAYLAVVAGLLVWTLLPLAAGWQVAMIMSDSMAPALRAGDVVVVQRRSDAEPGHVVLADDPDHTGRTRTHRVDSVRHDGLLVLRGDANPHPDSSPVAREDVHGIARLRVPFLGLPAMWLRTDRSAYAVLWLAVTVLAVVHAPTGAPGRGRRHRRRRTTQAAGAGRALGIAVVATTVAVGGGSDGLASHAAFSGTTATTASFRMPEPTCDRAGSVKVGAEADDWVDQAAPDTVQSGKTGLVVASATTRLGAGANRRTLVRFPLPDLPTGCRVTAATLVLTPSSTSPGRTLEAGRAGKGWTEGAVSWSSAPPTVGTPATALVGVAATVEFRVDDQVTEMYATRNHGFVVRDASEDDRMGAEQAFDNRESGATGPQLLISYG